MVSLQQNGFYVQIILLLLTLVLFSGCGNNCVCDDECKNTRMLLLPCKWKVLFKENDARIRNKQTLLELFRYAFFLQENPNVFLKVTATNISKNYEDDREQELACFLREKRVECIKTVFEFFDDNYAAKSPISDRIEYLYIENGEYEDAACIFELMITGNRFKIPSDGSMLYSSNGPEFKNLVEQKKYDKQLLPLYTIM